MKSAIVAGCVLAIFMMSSCKKEYCWQCTTTKGQPDKTTVVKQEALCGETEDQIEAYQLVNTYVTRVKEDSLEYTNTVCTRQ